MPRRIERAPAGSGARSPRRRRARRCGRRARRPSSSTALDGRLRGAALHEGQVDLEDVEARSRPAGAGRRCQRRCRRPRIGCRRAGRPRCVSRARSMSCSGWLLGQLDRPGAPARSSWRARMSSSAPLLNSGASSVAGERLIDQELLRAAARAAPATIVSTQARSSAVSVAPRLAAAANRLRGVGERRRRHRPDQALDADDAPGRSCHDRLVDRAAAGRGRSTSATAAPRPSGSAVGARPRGRR